MKVTTELPHNYVKLGDVRLKKNTGLLVVFNVLAIPLCIGSLWLFTSAALWLAPGFTLAHTYRAGLVELLILVGVSLGIIVGTIVLHELIHGAFFWFFSRKKPVFGFTWTYAYAAAPGLYFPRWQYLIVGLAPLVSISLLGLLLVPVLPYATLPDVVLAQTVNATGAIGDLYIATRLLLAPRRLLILDQSDQIIWYGPSTPNE